MNDTKNNLYPLTFTPALKDYIWGGRNLEELYGRQLPPTGPIAEMPRLPREGSVVP